MKNSRKNLFGSNIEIADEKVLSESGTGRKREFNERKLQESKNVEKITIDSALADVHVVSAKESEIDVRFSGKAQVDGDVRFSVKFVKNELKIAVEVDGKCCISSLKLDIVMPQTSFKEIDICGGFGDVCVENEGIITQKLDIKTSSGKIDIRRGSCVKRIALKTVSGSVYVDNTHGTEQMTIETSSGKVTVGKFVWSRTIDIQAVTGNVNMVGLGAEVIHVRSSTGKIEMAEGFFARKLNLETEIGNIVLEDGASEELNINTSSGKITSKISFANSIVNSGTGNVKIHINAEQDIKVKISTNIGNVAAVFANIRHMKLSTKSICGKVKNWHIDSLFGYRASVDISTVTGNIEIK